MEYPIRKHNRLRNYDYGRAGYYFVTICTKNKRQALWCRGAQCAPATPQLSNVGQLVEQVILSIPNHYEDVRVETYVVMPNHIHLILSLPENDGRTLCAPTVSRIVKQLKEIATKRLGQAIWQKGFYDHVIRNEADYLRIWTYMDQNPARWTDDRYFSLERGGN